jgi:hypothetical protein
MNAALDPTVAPILVPAGVAILVIATFVGAILVLFGRVRAWLRHAFQEYTESQVFDSTIDRRLNPEMDKLDADLRGRIVELKDRDLERMASVRLAHKKIDELGNRLDLANQRMTERIDGLFDRFNDIVTRLPTRMP